ncbi:hypothetical protein HY213_01540 [Candidatus Peregrinibacteria bacterium]|nr:hypothetical protein [Candidatus Peregrinibacteria bacterium]
MSNPTQQPSADVPGQEQELQLFLDEIFQLDQADPERGTAFECYRRLQQRRADFIESALEDAYWNAISLEAFHIAQIEASEGNTAEALRYGDIALRAARKTARLYAQSDWIPYLEATRAYFLVDLHRLQELIAQCGKNRGVVKNLLTGLQERGTPEYRIDYRR